jgi:hypothetical protein
MNAKSLNTDLTLLELKYELSELIWIEEVMWI